MQLLLGRFRLNDLYGITEMSWSVGMVLIHPSLSKCIRTQSAKTFRNERIAELFIWIIAAKDTILTAEVFSIVLSFLVKEESLSYSTSHDKTRNLY